MKKIIIITVSSVIVILLLAVMVVTTLISLNPKDEITDYVRENMDELETYATELIQTHSDNYQGEYQGLKVNYWKNSGMIEFSKSSWSFGIVPASTYRGFYYSSADKPIGFQGSMLYFKENGNGWKNYPNINLENYTERISEKWFYYEAKF